MSFCVGFDLIRYLAIAVTIGDGPSSHRNPFIDPALVWKATSSVSDMLLSSV